MIKFLFKNKLCLFTSQTSIWFLKLYYIIFVLIIIVPKKCNLNVWYIIYHYIMFIKGHKLFILPSIFNNKLHCLPNIVINF